MFFLLAQKCFEQMVINKEGFGAKTLTAKAGRQALKRQSQKYLDFLLMGYQISPS